MQSVRCAVIGAGWWGTWAHVPALAKHPRAELVAIQHHLPDEAQRVATDFDVPHALTTAEEVLAIEDLDAVVVSSTANLHYLQAKGALERGLHVLVEKPMTHTLAQAEELVNLAARKNLQLLVGCTFHYNRHAIEARSLIQSGVLGQIKLICIMFMDEILGLYQGQSWAEYAAACPDPEVDPNPYMAPGQKTYSDPNISGGGQIFNQVSHVAALIPFLTGDKPVDIYALLENAGAGVDVFDALTMKMQNGAIVSLSSGGAIGTGPRHLDVRIYGTKGVLEMELLTGKLEVWPADGQAKTYSTLTTDEELYPRYDPACNLIECALGESPNQSPGTLGLTAMKIIEGACTSAREGRNVAIG